MKKLVFLSLITFSSFAFAGVDKEPAKEKSSKEQDCSLNVTIHTSCGRFEGSVDCGMSVKAVYLAAEILQSGCPGGKDSSPLVIISGQN